jgi:hypothetical protein
MNDQSQSRLSQTPPTSARLRNQVTYEKHRREVMRQVYLPLIISVVFLCVIAGFLVVAGLGGSIDVSRLADVSLIWLIIPALIVTLVFLALTAGLTYGVIWLLIQLPPLTRRAQDFMARVNRAVRKGADKSAAPFIRGKGLAASWRALKNRFS